MVLSLPPIYDVGERPLGILLDDFIVVEDAPRGTAEALLLATEAELRTAGAGALIASCLAGSRARQLYRRHGYEPVTLYLAKSGFRPGARPPGVRIAGSEDAPDISRLGAQNRRTLSEINHRFWRFHPEADRRWAGFLRYLMTLKDREVVVAKEAGPLHGYVIPQPVSALHMPAAHDLTRVGMVDDYYDLDFADVPSLRNSGRTAADLLSAAESFFADRGYAAALAICPAAWTSKLTLLKRNGYAKAKLWMFKI
jgi:GNAT superfamily N-acetyltransferase